MVSSEMREDETMREDEKMRENKKMREEELSVVQCQFCCADCCSFILFVYVVCL